MNMNARIAILALLAALALTGCRSKSYESFVSATTPHPAKDKYMGDPSSAGGIGDANSGTKLGLETGSRKAGTVAPGYDEPARGGGQQPGENPVAGGSNGPVMQNKVTNSISGRYKQ